MTCRLSKIYISSSGAQLAYSCLKISRYQFFSYHSLDKMGAAGRKKVEESYYLQVWGPRVAQMLRQVADEGRKV